MSDSLSRWRNLALYAIAALVTAASLAAFTESYRGLYYWSAEHGLSGFWAYAWPIQLDAFIAVGELALFVALADRWAPRSRVLAWCVAVAGAVVSTAGNVGHMAGHSAWSMVSAGVPPVAAAAMLMVALGILKHVTTQGRPVTDSGALIAALGPPGAYRLPVRTVTVTAKSDSPRVTPRRRKTGRVTAEQEAARRDVSVRTIYREREKARQDLALANGNGKAHG